MTALPKRQSPARRWRTTIVGLILVAAVAYFAPHVASKTGMRHAILRAAAPEYQGELTVGSATLDWLSPVVLRNVRAIDAEGGPLLDARRIECEKTLWSLLVSRDSLGEIVIEKPVVHLVVRDDGTNVEDALAQILSADSDSSVDCSVRIVDGAVEARRDKVARRVSEGGGKKASAGAPLWRLHNVEAKIAAPQKAELRATISAVVEETEDAPGKVEAELKWNSGDGGWGRGELIVKAADAPLGLSQEALRRLGLTTRLSGLATASGRVDWEGGAGESAPRKWSAEISQLSLRQFSVTAPQHLGTDRFQLESLTGRGVAKVSGGRLDVDFQTSSELGFLDGRGSADWKVLLEGDNLTERLAAWNGDVGVSGELDLARLARVLPATLRIRRQTRITSGVVTAQVTCQKAGEERRWQGMLSAANLSAVNDGKPITWEKPIVVSASLRHSSSGPVLDSIDCKSSFLEASGRGDASAGEFSARGDLDRLAAELGQFVDLAEVRMAGKLEVNGRWNRDQAGSLAASADAKVQNLELAAPGWRPWRETSLAVIASAKGRFEGQRLAQLDEASLVLEAGDDKLDIRLAKSIATPTAEAAWPVNCQLSGELATWLPRIQTAAPLEGWSVRGGINLSAAGVATRQRIEVQSATAQIEQLQARSERFLIYEPKVNVEASGVWHSASRVLTLPSATLRSATVALRAEDIAIGVGSAPTLAGIVSYRGDLFRLLNWTHVDPQPPARQWAGEFTGALTVSRKEKATTFDSTTNFHNLSWLERTSASAAPRPLTPALTPAAGEREQEWRPLLREPNVAMAAKGELPDGQSMLDCQAFNASGFGWSVESQGKFAWPAETPRVDVQGRLRYDLAVVSDKLRTVVGGNFQAEGQETREFSLRGPVWEFVERAPGEPAALVTSVSSRPGAPPQPSPERGGSRNVGGATLISKELTGDGGVGWSTASLYGMNFGPGALRGKLAGGVVAFDPLEAAVGDGRLRVSPRIDLRQSPAMVVIDKGRVADQAAITPEMCQAWLKYVAPLVADATRAQGKISVDLSGASAPLADLKSLSAAGTMTIHGADVGPGPLSEQILLLANQIKALVERRPAAATRNSAGEWLRLGEQQVAFQVEQGRVYHQGLQIAARDVIIRTRGSVGLDQTLELVAEAPIQDQWIAKEPLLAGLKGRTLQIPIRGTLAEPKLDKRAFEEVSKQLVGGAAEKLLQDEIGKGLNRLLGPRN